MDISHLHSSSELKEKASSSVQDVLHNPFFTDPYAMCVCVCTQCVKIQHIWRHNLLFWLLNVLQGVVPHPPSSALLFEHCVFRALIWLHFHSSFQIALKSHQNNTLGFSMFLVGLTHLCRYISHPREHTGHIRALAGAVNVSWLSRIWFLLQLMFWYGKSKLVLPMTQKLV